MGGRFFFHAAEISSFFGIDLLEGGFVCANDVRCSSLQASSIWSTLSLRGLFFRRRRLWFAFVVLFFFHVFLISCSSFRCCCLPRFFFFLVFSGGGNDGGDSEQGWRVGGDQPHRRGAEGRQRALPPHGHGDYRTGIYWMRTRRMKGGKG